ncbi:MAG: LAGLIDADG family homing endonuclease [Solirubrobacteraceae bacterium]
MRWQNLTIEGGEQASLPGYREAATVRHFDAPEALDTRFYEIRAKSALNRVPQKSQMPFPWTINPYRGCSHACTYCLSGETLLLAADGRTRTMADLAIGDSLYGTVFDGTYRRYTRTEVRDKWITLKPAYRTTLEDGTELVTSGDHRFLTERGWKHVAPGDCCQRPHLTRNNELMGVGSFAKAPDLSADYMRGYLCGMVRGDGTLGTYSYDRGGRTAVVNRFRLALADREALDRARGFLVAAFVDTTEFVFATATDRRREVSAIRTSTAENVRRIRELIAWPHDVTDDWRKGFLAGIFDAEGSCSGGVLRISNKDSQILDWTAFCLRRFGFGYVVEPPAANGCRTVRVRGGLKERLRFFHMVDPAIRRKCDIEGTAIKSDARLRVVSVEPLGTTIPLYDITTGTGDFISNGVVSHNCFARPTHTYLDFNAGRDFEKEIVVKVNAPELVRAEVNRPAWKHEHVAMGTNTDPYQWVESKYKLMPPIWEALRDSGTPCSILTKSPLVLRDLPILETFAERGLHVQAAFSVPTLEEKAWRASEPHTPHPRKRLEAVGELTKAGIPASVLIAPLMPGINDDPKQVEKILEIAGEMGAVSVGGIHLHLRGEVRGVFMDWLRSYRPDLVERYEELYARGAYAPKEDRARIARLIKYRPREGGGWGTSEGMRRGTRTAAQVATGADRQHGDKRGLRGTALQESLF